MNVKELTDLLTVLAGSEETSLEQDRLMFEDEFLEFFLIFYEHVQ